VTVKLGIRRRILLALAALALLVASAAVIAVQTHRALHDELDEVAQLERRSRAALELSLAVRDLYAHQAHTIILGDESHLDHYDHSRQAVAVLLDVLEGLLERAPDPGVARVALAPELAEVAEMRGQVAALEDNFRRAIVPAIRGPKQALVAPHDRALALVDAIAARVDGLTVGFRQRAEEAQRRADVGHRGEVIWHLSLVVLAAGFAAGVGVYLTRAIARPLADLRAGAERLARGELGTRIAVPPDRDLGSLAIAFNTMAAELARRQEQLVASEKLASVGRIAAGIAHEINNPLAVIVGHARLLERHPDPGVADDARRVGLEAERCREIVQGLLDLARPTRLAWGEVELAELVADVAEALTRAGTPCVVEVSGGAPTVPADPRKLRQIVWNLLRNAAEAAPGEAIAVALSAGPEVLEMRVSDPGPGIDEAIIGQLFEPFQTTKPEGTGLGLAVSRALARAHGGELTLHAQRPTTFRLTLPATRGEPPSQEPASGREAAA